MASLRACIWILTPQKTHQESNCLHNNVILRFDCWPHSIIQVIRSQYADTRTEYVQFSGCQQGVMTLDDEITTWFRRAWARNIPHRAQYFGKTELSIYSSRWALSVLLSVGDEITSLSCCNGYQRYPTAFMFSEGRTFRRTLTQPSGCHGENSKNIYLQGKTISFFLWRVANLLHARWH